MVTALGIDLVDVARIEKAVERWGGRFLSRVFTPAEIEYCTSRGERFRAGSTLGNHQIRAICQSNSARANSIPKVVQKGSQKSTFGSTFEDKSGPEELCQAYLGVPGGI